MPRGQNRRTDEVRKDRPLVIRDEVSDVQDNSPLPTEPQADERLEVVYGAFAMDWLDEAGDLSHEAVFISALVTDLAT